MADKKLDILVFAAHPDDAEIGCAGTILAHVAQGKKVGVIDLTLGEMGTRGTPEMRLNEAATSSQVLGISVRENLKMKDAFFVNDLPHQMQIVKKIRQYNPDIVLATSISDRHPDHGKSAELVKQACFLSGLIKIETKENGEIQTPHRPKQIYYYLQNDYITPDILVDVTDFWQQKMKAVLSFKTQFHDPKSVEPKTYISSPNFITFLEARAVAFGRRIGVKYAEGFVANRPIGTGNLFNLL